MYSVCTAGMDNYILCTWNPAAYLTLVWWLYTASNRSMNENQHTCTLYACITNIPEKTSTSVLITRLERLGGPQITHQIKQQSNSVPKFKNFLYHDTRALLHNKINIVQKNGYDHPSPLTWTQQWHIVAGDVDIQYTFDLLFYVCAFGREILGHLSPCSKEYIHLMFPTLWQIVTVGYR